MWDLLVSGEMKGGISYLIVKSRGLFHRHQFERNFGIHIPSSAYSDLSDATFPSMSGSSTTPSLDPR